MAPPAVLLFREQAGRQLVVCCCEAAAKAGVTNGMTVAQARALLGGRRGGLVLSESDTRGDETALIALARWCIRFSPVVAPDPPDGLLLDVAGCERLYGTEANMLRIIEGSLRRLGLNVRAACASTVGCAWALARHGPESGAHASGLCASPHRPKARATVLNPLPVAALRLDEPTIAGLREVGIETIGEVLALPRNDLAQRFGPDLLRRIDQALGDVPEPINPVRLFEAPRVEIEFAGPVKDLNTILLAGHDLVKRLVPRLERLERGVQQLDVLVERSDAPPLSTSFPLSRPSRQDRHLWSLLRPRLESMNMGFGVERLALTATRTAILPHQPMPLPDHEDEATPLGVAPDERVLGELIDSLAQRLGPDRVVCLQPVESYVPERSACAAPAQDFYHGEHGENKEKRKHRKPNPSSVNSVFAVVNSIHVHPCSSVVPPDRPSLLLERPERIDVMAMTPEGPPLWLRWRGNEHRTISACGPERITKPWWQSRDVGGDEDHAAHRDYYRLQDEQGRWLWVFRAATTGEWFIHGEWC